MKQEVTVTGLHCQSGDVREGRKESTRKQVGKHIEFSLVPGMKPLHEVAGTGRGDVGLLLAHISARVPFQQPPH